VEIARNFYEIAVRHDVLSTIMRKVAQQSLLSQTSLRIYEDDYPPDMVWMYIIPKLRARGFEIVQVSPDVWEVCWECYDV
jgi:hypothetical protein